MAARTADPAFTFPGLSNTLTEDERLAVPNAQDPVTTDNLGAFRGLAYALILQFLFGFIGLGVWMLLRRAR
jgi:hypothetical protein